MSNSMNPASQLLTMKATPSVQPTNSRTELLEDVIAAVQVNLAQEDPSFGVNMIDVRIKRADFPQEVAGTNL